MRIPPQTWMTAPETRAVMDILNRDGDMARFVGGCVRSAVLDLPIADVDIATRYNPETVTKILEAEGIRVVPTGLEHGTVTAVVNHEHFEITTLRLDVETDGRRAVVAFTEDWREDAARRDFTMNAMFMRPDGSLDDPFGGHSDALAGKVRFVGDPVTRIREDVLRILRFFRFHAHYGRGAIDPAGLHACHETAPLIRELSGERIRVEFLKLLVAPSPLSVLEIMEKSGVLPVFLPGPYDFETLSRLIAFGSRTPDPVLRLAAFAPERADQAFRASERMRFSNAEAARFHTLSTTELAPLPEEAAARREIYRHGNALFEDLIRLQAARGVLDLRHAERLRTLSAHWPKPELPVRGADLVKMGLAAGPAVGEALRRLEAWWIAGDFAPDRETCLAETRRIIAEESK
ncbi:CCA tRNA nucleotidyltransferase [Nisaea acidiphila]|uniref:CCA tRNA nucleotidyltransferase n=1 Tax=Nisaea acidiphila TaxID=1862145 RepID=A0A9J7AMY4_9PROT|nr:CCA tRNA nucleotidyltransferase [Nisaea acidiphila]UUX48526.1 CCA tRNA nucleotidyltransferase [Nisaea acidiphila]